MSDYVRPAVRIGALIFSGLLGLAFAAAVVQLALLRGERYSIRQSALWALIAVLIVWIVAKIVAYFLLRVYINDHYETNDELSTILVIAPATIGAVLGGLFGAVIARYNASEHRRPD